MLKLGPWPVPVPQQWCCTPVCCSAHNNSCSCVTHSQSTQRAVGSVWAEELSGCCCRYPLGSSAVEWVLLILHCWLLCYMREERKASKCDREESKMICFEILGPVKTQLEAETKETSRLKGLTVPGWACWIFPQCPPGPYQHSPHDQGSISWPNWWERPGERPRPLMACPGETEGGITPQTYQQHK